MNIFSQTNKESDYQSLTDINVIILIMGVVSLHYVTHVSKYLLCNRARQLCYNVMMCIFKRNITVVFSPRNGYFDYFHRFCSHITVAYLLYTII